LKSTGVVDFDTSLLETVAYHLFTVSFISIGLTGQGDNDGPKGRFKELLKGSLWMSLIFGISLPLQAIIGALVIYGYNMFNEPMFEGLGFLAGLGFTLGPGQALSIGKVWETFNVQHAATLGLTFAAIGYFIASFVGVPLANWGLRKGYASSAKSRVLGQEFLKGIMRKEGEKENIGENTMHSANVDTMAFHLALVGLVYFLTYAFVKFLNTKLSPENSAMQWGFFFMWGMTIALIVRWFMGKIGIRHLIDAGVQRKITGTSVDFLIISTLTAVQIGVIRQYLILIVLISLIAGSATTILILYFGRRLESFSFERTMGIYGTCTGTASSGLLLLRIVDPEFKSPAALEVGVMNFFNFFTCTGSMILISAPVVYKMSMTLTLLIFAAIIIGCIILLKLVKLWGAKAY
jgi:ESS family glutamate:Na+ symporter